MISFFHPLSLDGKNLWPNFHFRFFPKVSRVFSFFPKIKHFFSPKQNEILDTSSGRTQDVFPFFSRAEKATGLNRQTIRDVLERGNKVYHRKADHKLFHISKEDPILIARIEGEEFFSLEEIQTKLGLSPTRFLNQIKSGKFAKKIDWISDELFSERNQQEKKSDELEVLREEMRLQFEKFQTEMAKFQEEIARLSSKVEKLEKKRLNLLLAQQKFLLRKKSQQFSKHQALFLGML